jgi:peptidyl-tRNA hydrolase, PTH1 family
MYLVVGLGNPGEKYKLTRHNVGFLAVDSLVQSYGFSSENSKYNSDFFKGTIGDQKILAIKPMTFMNESGKAVSAFSNFYKIPAENIIVLHDDIDLDLAKIKIKIAGGTAGHNGLRSINSMVSNKYTRVRIGVDHPQNKDLVSKYVLEDFSKGEFGAINNALDRISQLFPEILEGDNDIFGSEVNQINKN